jgi:UDP-glucuronate decarboxylase
VICIDNFVTSAQANISHLLRNPYFVFIRHDINEPIVLEDIAELESFNLEVAGIKYIYNLACPTSPKNFEQHKVQTALANSLGVKNTLDLAIKYQAKYLYTSSSVVYGGAEDGSFVFKEDTLGCVDQTSPRACYDEGKRFAEAMVMTYQDFYKLDTKIARIFRTYGPRMPLNDGQMIPDFIVNALDGKDLVIYGDQEYTSTFCYVTDVVDGLVKLMKSSLQQPVNIGSPDNYLVTEVAQYITGLVGSSSKITHDPPLNFMRPLGLPDISLARDSFGWFPIVTMGEGLKQTIEYTIAHKNLVSFKSE